MTTQEIILKAMEQHPDLSREGMELLKRVSPSGEFGGDTAALHRNRFSKFCRDSLMYGGFAGALLEALETAAAALYTPVETDEPMTIAGAWYIDMLPHDIVAEMADGTLWRFPISPFYAVTADYITPYDGQHPRKQRGTPLPAALYPYYGLKKSDESLSEVVHVRLTPTELERVKAAAAADDKTISELARDWIRSL